MLGAVCALHLYHRRRTLQARPNLQVRVDQQDLEALDRLAQTCNLSRSEAFRRVLKHLPLPKPKTDAETYRELRRIGLNINQIAHCLNRGEDPEFQVITKRLDQLSLLLEDLALGLCGVCLEPGAEA
jgi:hypothetical protein